MATWILWAALPMIAAAAAFAEGAGTAALSIGGTGLGPLLVFSAGVLARTGVWDFNKVNALCVASAFAATLGWWVTSEPLVAAVLATAGDAAAFVPTLRRILSSPGQENPWVYISGLLSSSTALLVLPDLTLTGALFPGYIACACVTALLLELRSPTADRSRDLIAAPVAD